MEETPFFLVYGAEVVLPPDIRLKSPRVLMFSQEKEAERRYDDLDLSPKKRAIEPHTGSKGTSKLFGNITASECAVGF